MPINDKAFQTLPKIPATRIESDMTPIGGGACHWCSAQLYRRGKTWVYALVEEDGYKRAVHLRQCSGPDADLRPNQSLSF
jgi:hypothetical protein